MWYFITYNNSWFLFNIVIDHKYLDKFSIFLFYLKECRWKKNKNDVKNVDIEG